jgi:hypothetical protein
MHPEIMRQLTAQRGRDMRAQARQAQLARMAIRNRRHARKLAAEANVFVMPAIPDYVDGSFRSGPAGHQAASEAGAAHHAA